MPPVPLAHETWFLEREFHSDWDFAAEPLTLALLGAAVLVAVSVRLLARVWPGVDVPFLTRMAPWMPFAVRMHLAVSLVGLLSMGDYLSAAMDLPATVPGIVLGIDMALVAIGMATGYRTREAAWLLVALGPIGMAVFGVGPILQRADLLGLAAFVIIAGPGPWSADHELGRARRATKAELARAVWALRLAVGGALIVVAFAEKLAYPDTALAFLADRPDFNVAQLAGLPLGDLEFTRVAGSIEVLFGLLIVSGALPQACVVLAGIPFNTTLWFFGETELIGHLPVYGAMLVLLVLGSDAELRPLVSDLWPWGRGESAARAPSPEPAA